MLGHLLGHDLAVGGGQGAGKDIVGARPPEHVVGDAGVGGQLGEGEEGADELLCRHAGAESRRGGLGPEGQGSPAVVQLIPLSVLINIYG